MRQRLCWRKPRFPNALGRCGLMSKNKKIMEQLRLVLVLTLIAAFSGGILAVVNHLTEPRIKELERQATNEALALCLPGAGDFQKEESLPAGAGADVSEVYLGYVNNEPAGVVVKVEPKIGRAHV